MAPSDTDRRKFLKSASAAGVSGIIGASAGCVGFLGDDDVGEEFPEIQFVYPTSGANAERNDLGTWIADNMEEVGFEVDRQERDFDAHVDQTVVDQDFDVSLLGWGGTPERIDPHIFLMDMHHSDFTEAGGRNTPGYENPDYDELAEDQAVTVDRDDRQNIVYDAQEMLAEDQPRCYIANEGGDHPWNNDRLESVNPVLGEGLNGFWNFMDMEPADGTEQVFFGYPTNITSLNPLQDLATPDRQFIRLLYDQLYRFDEQGDPIPWLAVDEPEIEDDGLTLTVEIRDDHTFHDGTDVTVDDVVYSYELFEEHSPTYATYLEPIDEMTTSGNEITFHLDEVDATFESNALAQIYIFPEHIWSEIENPVEEDDEDYIGSGPFQFEDWERDVELQLSRFDDHFQPPNVEELIRVPGDENTLIDELENYDLDLLGTVPTPIQRDRIEDDDDLGLASWDAVGHAKLAYNFRREHMTDVHVRRAISYCVPKQAYIDEIRGGMGSVTHSPISPAVEFWHNPDVKEYDEDLDAAEAELEEAGYVWDSDGQLHYPEEDDDE